MPLNGETAGRSPGSRVFAPSALPAYTASGISDFALRLQLRGQLRPRVFKNLHRIPFSSASPQKDRQNHLFFNLQRLIPEPDRRHSRHVLFHLRSSFNPGIEPVHRATFDPWLSDNAT